MCLFFEVQFIKYRVLGWQFYSFSTLNISSHCFLASLVSAEKSVDNPFEDLLCVMNHVLLSGFCLCIHCGSFWVCPTWSLEFLGFVASCIASNLRSFLTLFLEIISLPFSLSSPSGSALLCWHSRDPLVSAHFIFFLSFLLLRLDNINGLLSSSFLILSPVSLNLLLNPCSESLISLIVVFSAKICLVPFHNLSLYYILIFFTHCFPDFLLLCSCFHLPLWACWRQLL